MLSKRILLIVGGLIALSIFVFVLADIIPDLSNTQSPDSNFSSQKVIVLNVTQQDNFERLLEIDTFKINETRFQINLQVNESLMNDIKTCRALSGIPKLTCFQNIKQTYFADITLQDILDSLNSFESFPVTNLTTKISVEKSSLNLSKGSATFYVDLIDYDSTNVTKSAGQRFKIGWHSITIETVESTNVIGYFSSVALDSNGYVHISHFDTTNNNLRYCNNTLGSWSCSSIGNIGADSSKDRTSIAIDSNNKVHILAANSTLGGLTYCNNTLGSWGCEAVIGISYKSVCSIALDSNNKVHLSVLNYGDSGAIYCNNTLGSWSCSSLAFGCNAVEVNSIVINSTNAVFIITVNNCNGDLILNQKINGASSSTIIKNGAAYTEYGTGDLGIDSNGYLHLVYGDNSVNYCNNTLGSWSCSSIDTNINADVASLAIDANNNIHIFSYDGTNLDLRYCNNIGGWLCSKIADYTSSGIYYLGYGGENIAIKKGRLLDSTSFSNTANLVWGSGDLFYANQSFSPLVDISYPTFGLYLNYNQSIPLNFSIYNNSPLSHCLYSTNSYTTNTSFSCVNTQFNVTEGSKTILLWVNDSAGIVGVDSVTFIIDITNPLISYGTGVENNNTNFSRNWIFVNVSITETNFKNLTFYLYNTSLVNSTTYTGSTRSINFTNLANGLYYFNATTYDQANNVNSTDTRWIRLDTKAPALTLTRPLAQTYGTNLSLPLNYTVSDATTYVSQCWYKVVNSTSNIIINNLTISNCQNTTFDVPRTDTYTLTLYTNDSLNQLNYSSVTFSVSLTAPAVVLDYPTSVQYLNSKTNVNLNFTATDTDGISQCQLYSNFTGVWELNQTFTSVSSGVQKSTQKNLSDNLYLWNVWCNDTFNNNAWALNNLTFTIDTIYPNVSIDSITTTVASQIISFNSSANDTNLNSCKYSIYDSTNAIDGANENISISCNSNPHSATVSGFATYTLKVYAIDLSGNENSTNLSFTTSATSGTTVLGGGGSADATPQDLGYCGDNTCNSARGEDFYSCPSDCKARFGDFNLDKILFNCIDKDSTNECFWTKNPGYVTLFIILAMVFIFFTLFQIKPTSTGSKRAVYVGPSFKKKRK